MATAENKRVSSPGSTSRPFGLLHNCFGIAQDIDDDTRDDRTANIL
ncbi:MAG: hypothetical protein RIB71_15790 [Imperialibacter sp.]